MSHRYRFGRHEVRSDERSLLVDGQPAVLGARAFDLLLALIEQRNRVVTKDELLRTVWRGLVVGENNLHTQISTLRGLLGAQAIVTLPGRGYRFAAKVDSEPATASGGVGSPGLADGPGTGAEKAGAASAAPDPGRYGTQLQDLSGPPSGASGAVGRATPTAPQRAVQPLASLPFRFGRTEVRPAERQLFVAGQPVGVGSRAFELLLTLIELRPRVVSKNELLDRVWPGVVVEENNLQTQVSTLRKLLGPQAIETIPGLGYRFAMALEGEADLALAPTLPAPEIVPHTARLTNLPAAAEALFGRRDDIDALAGLVSEHRLVTVLGAGGIGKTSVAQALARQLVGRYANGVWWVDLASIASADSIAIAIASAANLQLGEVDATASLLRTLSSRETLLVLDNCERLASEIAHFTQAALAAAPRLRILSTSRETLRLPAEKVYRLDPLAVPSPGTALHEARTCGALQLFEQRARAVDRHFSLSTANIEAAIRLCRRLDGIALAIEMAAARLPLLGVAGLDAKLGERLRLLKSNSRAAPARHQTLRATLDWSHALLTPEEQTVLRRLAAFAASFRLDTAKRVASSESLDEWAVVDAMAALVDKSLVQVEQHDPPRYRLLETTRLYSAERLAEHGEADVTMQRYGQALALLADEVEQAYWVMPDSSWLSRYAPEYDDLQAAFDRACLQADADVGAATLDGLFRLDHLRATFAPIRLNLLAAARLLPSAGPIAEPRLHLRLSTFFVDGDAGTPKLPAAQQAATAFRKSGESRRLYEAQLSLAVNCAIAGRFEDAERALSEAGALEDPRWPPRLHWLGAHHRARVQARRADARAYRANAGAELSFAEQAGSPCQAASARINLTDAAVMAGDWDEAVARARDAVHELQTLDLPYLLAVSLVNLCAALMRTGDLSAARAVALEALPVVWQNNLSGYLLCHLSLLATGLSRPECAARMLGKVEAWLATNQCTLEPNELHSTQLAARVVDAALDPSDVAASRRAGAALTDAQAHTLAEELLSESDQDDGHDRAASARAESDLRAASGQKR